MAVLHDESLFSHYFPELDDCGCDHISMDVLGIQPGLLEEGGALHRRFGEFLNEEYHGGSLSGKCGHPRDCILSLPIAFLVGFPH